MFKKNKIHLKKQHNFFKKLAKFIGYSFLTLSILFIITVGVVAIATVSKFDIKTDFITNMLQGKSITENIEKTSGKTNILIVGRGGYRNEAPNLTDTIILASINYDKNIISLFSIPRDLFVEYEDSKRGKINETFLRALKRNNNDEALAMKVLYKKIKEITNEDINYYVNLDFDGFEKMIDFVGGVDIEVANTIIDRTYPTANYGYKTFKLEAGTHTLDGETALMYARSRHSTSDFDRSLRQQAIMSALKDKLVNLGYLTTPGKIKGLFDIVSKYVKTDIDVTTLISLATYVKDLPKENIISSNLNDGAEVGGFLYTPLRENYGGLSVLLPDASYAGDLNDYSQIHKYTNLIFNYPEIYKNKYEINIFNAGKSNGVAYKVAATLRKYGFNVPLKNATGNTAGETYENNTIIYNNITTLPDQTVDALKLFFIGDTKLNDLGPKYSKEPTTKIEVILGPNFKTTDM